VSHGYFSPLKPHTEGLLAIFLGFVSFTIRLFHLIRPLLVPLRSLSTHYPAQFLQNNGCAGECRPGPCLGGVCVLPQRPLKVPRFWTVSPFPGVKLCFFLINPFDPAHPLFLTHPYTNIKYAKGYKNKQKNPPYSKHSQEQKKKRSSKSTTQKCATPLEIPGAVFLFVVSSRILFSVAACNHTKPQL